MLVEELKFDPLLIKGPAETEDNLPPRSVGTLHLSQIYGDIENTLAPKEEMSDDELCVYRAGGFIWERVWSAAFAQSIRTGDIVRPGEYACEGIVGSPDNFDFLHWRGVETKCTWKTSRKLDHLEKYFWVWLVQMKGYCRMMGTQEYDLYAFFMMGNYKGSGPQIRHLRFRWSEQEIMSNWTMIKNHARRRGWLK